MGKALIIKGADFSNVAASVVNIELPKVVITVVASPAGGGTTTGTGSYDIGDEITITAVPAQGYKFIQWNDGNTNATRTITVGDSAQTFTAEFQELISLVNHLTGCFLNSIGEVRTGAQYSSYDVKFCRVNDGDSVLCSTPNSGVGGSGAPIWVLYSGLNSDNVGTGKQASGIGTIGEPYSGTIDTSTYKIIGVCWRTDFPNLYYEPTLTVVE